MEFTGISNQSVEIKIDSFDLDTEKERDNYNSTWLNIYLNVKSDFGDWQTTEPILLPWEFKNIIKWLTDLANNNVTKSVLQFIEPNLSFHLIDNDKDLKKIQIVFTLESKPPLADEKIKYFVDCLLTNDELLEKATELKGELDKYPAW